MGDFEDVGSENVKVVLRIRPLNDVERGRGDKTVLTCMEDRRSVRLSSMGMEDFGRATSRKDFTFSACLDEKCDQESFFEQCGVKSLISKTLDGYSTTLFAYGQTGSGKTYSISGAEDVIVEPNYTGGDAREGVIPRAARMVFEEVANFPQREYVVKAACFEIYNEQVLDLLNPDAGQLQVRESKSQGFFVENLLVVECSCVADLMEVFKEGTRNRKVGPHAMNRDSSRSHSALVIYVDGTNKESETGENIRQYGKLTCVDLAGSERLKYTGSSGEMLKETGNINRSLFTLGKVIATLDKGDSFVPYRDSKLTKLLMDSLGGTSMCLMLACCSPSSKYAEETLSTLQYASRAKNIKNKPVIQLDPQQKLIQMLREEIRNLRQENAALRAENGLPPSWTRSSEYGSSRNMFRNSQQSSRGFRSLSLSETTGGNLSPGRESSRRRGSAYSMSGIHSDPTTPTTPMGQGGMPPYEKAVGYAEGYAAGLDQVREVLSSRGLDIHSSLATYDISSPANGSALSRPPSFRSRLPPLSSRASSLSGNNSDNGDLPAGLQDLVGNIDRDNFAHWFADSIKNGTMLEEHTFRIMNEFVHDVSRVKTLNAKLQEDHQALEHKCKSWEEESRRVQSELDSHVMASRQPQQSGSGDLSYQERIIQQAKFARIESENVELKRRLLEMQNSQSVHLNDGARSAHDSAWSTREQRVPAAFRPGEDEAIRSPGPAPKHGNTHFCSTEGPIWAHQDWDSEAQARAHHQPHVPSAKEGGGAVAVHEPAHRGVGAGQQFYPYQSSPESHGDGSFSKKVQAPPHSTAPAGRAPRSVSRGKGGYAAKNQ